LQKRAEPDRDIGLKPYFADDMSTGRNPELAIRWGTMGESPSSA
jgi:hypothetical protein